MRRAALPLLASAMLSAGPALADDGALRRFALVMGSNDGGDGRVELRYAGSDAHNIARVLTDLGGVAEGDLVVLEEPSIERITRAFEVLSGRILAARSASDRVEVVVYYSGHSDDLGMLPGGVRYAYTRLRAELARLDADVRVAILDSCSSGALIRAKGGTRRLPFLVDQANTVRGEAYLTSSTATEASQESDRIGASFFTHHLVAGLRGAADVDADGLVTLREAYAYTFRETRESTETSRIGPQSPYYALDLEGQGDVILTDLRAATSRLVLDDALDGEVWVRGSDGRLLAQIGKAPGRELSLSIPTGAWTVTLQSRPASYVADVVIRDGSPVRLDAGDFHPVELVADGRPRGQETPPPAATIARPLPERTVSVDAQVVGVRRGKKARTRVEGAGFHLFTGTQHSLRGAAIAGLGTRTLGDLDGAQLAFGWTTASGDARGFQGSFFANVVGGHLSGVQATGLVNVVRGDSPEATFGTQLAGLVNVANGGRKGGQVSGLVNVNRGPLTGLQLTYGVNVVGGRVSGLQFSGLANIAREDVRGAQWSSIFNGAFGLRGAQLGLVNRVDHGSGVQLGLVNVARQLQGFQLGLFNVADRLEGEALGLVTIARNGYHAFELWSDDLAPVSVGFKFGSPHIYTTVIVGVDPVEDVTLSFGAGLGGHATFFDDKLFLDADVVLRTAEAESGSLGGLGHGLVTSLRVSVGGDVAGPFGLFIGPAFHLTLPTTGDAVPTQTLMPSFALGDHVVGTIGYQAGMRVRF